MSISFFFERYVMLKNKLTYCLLKSPNDEKWNVADAQ